MPRQLIVVALLALASPAWSATTRGTTYAEPTLGRWQTLCDDGTRAISSYNRTLERWDTTLTESRKPVCTVRMDPTTKQMRVRCR